MKSFSRIIVIGCSGSGKSTVAEILARKLDLPYMATDHCYWTEDWKPVPQQDVRTWADKMTSADNWVFDGNFDEDRDLVWARAELAVWMDLPLFVTVWRVLCRNLSWWVSRQKVWGGKRMTLSKVYSGIKHSLYSHSRKRNTYPTQLAEFPQLQSIRLTSAKQVGDWLGSLPGDEGLK